MTPSTTVDDLDELYRYCWECTDHANTLFMGLDSHSDDNLRWYVADGLHWITERLRDIQDLAANDMIEECRNVNEYPARIGDHFALSYVELTVRLSQEVYFSILDVVDHEQWLVAVAHYKLTGRPYDWEALPSLEVSDMREHFAAIRDATIPLRVLDSDELRANLAAERLRLQASERTRSDSIAARRHASDGPTSPGCWSYRGREAKGLQSKPWRFAKALYEAEHGTVEITELGEAVNGDRVDEPTPDDGKNWQRAAKKWFLENNIPLSISKSGMSFTIRETEKL